MLLLALLIPFCIGFACFKMQSYGSPFKSVGYYLYIVLGIALGAGICSWLYFVCLWLFGTPLISVGFEIALLIALILFEKKWSVYFVDVKTTNKKLRIINLICILIFAGCFINTLWNFMVYSLYTPHGQWDAVAIWNVKARFLYPGTNWKGMFSMLIPFTHPDYPIFLPGFIAHCWMLMKSNSTSAAITASAFFTLGTGALLFTSLSFLKGTVQGLVAGLLILSTPFFISHGTSQYADVTLGFFFLATFVCLAIADGAGTNAPFFYLIAGLFAGFAAWTKNEGLLFFATVLLSRVILAGIKKSKLSVKTLCYFVLGSLPVIILILMYKHFLTPVNDIVSHQHGTTIEKLKDFSRYRLVFSHFWKTGLDFGQWDSKPHLWFFVLLLLFGVQVKKNLQIGIICSSIALILTLIGYFFIFVTTPYDIEWHIGTSLNRLLIQLFPSFLFLYFMALKPFELSFLATIAKEEKVIAKPARPINKQVKRKR